MPHSGQLYGIPTKNQSQLDFYSQHQSYRHIMKIPKLPLKPELTPVIVIGGIILISILAVGGIFYFAGFFSSTSISTPTGNVSVSNESSGSSLKYVATFSNLSLSSVNVSNLEIVLNVSTSSGSDIVILQYSGNNTLGSYTGTSAYWYAFSSSSSIKDGSSITIAYSASPGYGGSLSATALFGPLYSIQFYVLGDGGGEFASHSF